MHLNCRVTPMLALYAIANVVVTVAAGTRCAWYGLTGPLNADQLLPGPGVWYFILYQVSLSVTGSYQAVPGFSRDYLPFCSNSGVMGESCTKYAPEEEKPPQRLFWVPAAMLGCDSTPRPLRDHSDQVPLNSPSETVFQPGSTTHFQYGFPTVEPLSSERNKLLSENRKTAIL